MKIKQPHGDPPLKGGAKTAAFERIHQMVELHHLHRTAGRGDDLDHVEPGLKRAGMLHQVERRGFEQPSLFGRRDRLSGSKKRAFAARFDLYEGNIRAVGRDYVDLPEAAAVIRGQERIPFIAQKTRDVYKRQGMDRQVSR